MGSAEHHDFGDLHGQTARTPPRADQPAFERHYRLGELADMWSLGRETVRLLIKDEPGVIRIRLGRKKAHTFYSVPESVAVRIHTRLLSGRS
jgi:hypothetical protein